MADTDTSNRFLVTGGHGDPLNIQRVPAGPLSTEDALNLAAWLAVLADPHGDRLAALIEKIQES